MTTVGVSNQILILWQLLFGFFVRMAAKLIQTLMQNDLKVGEYVGQCLENAEPLEFFSCWNGDETLPVEKHRWITLENFRAPEFYCEERQLTIVYEDQSSLQAARGVLHFVDLDG